MNHYTEFTPQERWALTVAAEGRGDDVEVGRLWRSCPQVKLVGPDPKYYDLVLRLEFTVQAVIRDWTDVSHYVATTGLWGIVCADEVAVAAKANADWKTWSARWKGIEAATAKFCTEVGLTFEQLFGPTDERSPVIDEARTLLHPKSRIDRGSQDAMYQRLHRAWEGK